MLKRFFFRVNLKSLTEPGNLDSNLARLRCVAEMRVLYTA